MIDLFHCRAGGFVRPRGPLAACGARDDVVELDPVRASQIALRLRRQPEQIHADGFPWEVLVAVHLQGSIALRDDLTTPYRLHGDSPPPGFRCDHILTSLRLSLGLWHGGAEKRLAGAPLTHRTITGHRETGGSRFGWERAVPGIGVTGPRGSAMRRQPPAAVGDERQEEPHHQWDQRRHDITARQSNADSG